MTRLRVQIKRTYHVAYVSGDIITTYINTFASHASEARENKIKMDAVQGDDGRKNGEIREEEVERK